MILNTNSYYKPKHTVMKRSLKDKHHDAAFNGLSAISQLVSFSLILKWTPASTSSLKVFTRCLCALWQLWKFVSQHRWVLVLRVQQENSLIVRVSVHRTWGKQQESVKDKNISPTNTKFNTLTFTNSFCMNNNGKQRHVLNDTSKRRVPVGARPERGGTGGVCKMMVSLQDDSRTVTSSSRIRRGP